MYTITTTQAIQIRCIKKIDRYNIYQRIAGVGGLNSNGTRWYLPEEDAIKGIETGKWSFYVTAAGRTVNVLIALHNGNKYLKTQIDGVKADNLLSLPECP